MTTPVGVTGSKPRQFPINLIGRHLNEPPNAFLERGCQKYLCTHHVGPNEGHTGLNGTVHVRLGREMKDDIDPGHNLLYDLGLTDVTPHETISLVGRHICEALQISGVRQSVEDDDFDIRLCGEKVPHEIRPNEAGATGDQAPHPSLPEGGTPESTGLFFSCATSVDARNRDSMVPASVHHPFTM